jgi:DNA primase large subunit
VYSDYEISNQLVTELFYDIDVDQADTRRSILNHDRMLNHDRLKIFMNHDNHDIDRIYERVDVVELIVQLEPIISKVRSLYSGRRGVHLHIDLYPVRVVDLRRASEHVAELFGIIDVVDKQVLGDWRRVARVPYTYHKLTGQECVLLNPTTDAVLMKTLSELLHEKFTSKTCNYTVLMPSETREAATVLGEPPPCISYLLGQLSAGQDLSHQARLHLGVYLLKIGLKPDEAAVLFKPLPDFNYETSCYQLQWLYRHNYKMYSCEKAKQYGLCPLPVDGCKYAPSPNWWF